jgi:hypothetical protein
LPGHAAVETGGWCDQRVACSNDSGEDVYDFNSRCRMVGIRAWTESGLRLQCACHKRGKALVDIELVNKRVKKSWEKSERL